MALKHENWIFRAISVCSSWWDTHCIKLRREPRTTVFGWTIVTRSLRTTTTELSRYYLGYHHQPCCRRRRAHRRARRHEQRRRRRHTRASIVSQVASLCGQVDVLEEEKISSGWLLRLVIDPRRHRALKKRKSLESSLKKSPGNIVHNSRGQGTEASFSILYTSDIKMTVSKM